MENREDLICFLFDSLNVTVSPRNPVDAISRNEGRPEISKAIQYILATPISPMLIQKNTALKWFSVSPVFNLKDTFGHKLGCFNLVPPGCRQRYHPDYLPLYQEDPLLTAYHSIIYCHVYYIILLCSMHLCREIRLEPKDSSFVNVFSLLRCFLKSFFFISVFFSFLSSFWIMLYLYIKCYVD